jgi:hypothetical protein
MSTLIGAALFAGMAIDSVRRIVAHGRSGVLLAHLRGRRAVAGALECHAVRQLLTGRIDHATYHCAMDDLAHTSRGQSARLLVNRHARGVSKGR